MTVNTTFIFVSTIQDQGYLSMVLDGNQRLVGQPEVIDFATLHTRQEQYPGKTTVVISSQLASLQQVTLPRLPDKKARLAVPFALEDNLAQPLDSLHFAFDNHFHKEGQYLVAIIEKNIIESIIQQLHEHHIRFETITLDWFALLPDEILCRSDYALVNHSTFQGALAYPLLPLSWDSLATCKQVYHCPDSDINTDEIPPHMPQQVETDTGYTWIAKRLLNHPYINLCQERFVQNNNQHQIKKWYIYAATLATFWLISTIGLILVHWFTQQKEIRHLDEQIAVVYHQFFPQAQQVINPRFRISQYLKTTQNTTNDTFWSLLVKFSQVLHDKNIELTHLQWQNETLQIQCTTPDFMVLNQLEEQLKNAGLQVKQSQAATENESIHSTLELSL